MPPATVCDAPAAAIEIRDLQFAWPGEKPILDIPALSLKRGERALLTGASGSGKSTLLGLVAGVLVPTRGTISVLGTRIAELPAAKRDAFRGAHIGFIFQMFNLLPYLSVRANVELALRFSDARENRLQGISAEHEALRLLSALGLSLDLVRRSVATLSIGQQQRVAAARALLGRPGLIIADEPTSALDGVASADLLRLLMQECTRHATTLLFASHDLNCAKWFDRRMALEELGARPVAQP